MSAEPLRHDPGEATDINPSNEKRLLRSLGIADIGDDAGETDATEPDGLDRELALVAILDDPHLTQHTTRSRVDGCETIVGHFRCEFAESQQRAILHVPICPPMESEPSVQTLVVQPSRDTLNWISEARIRVTDRQKFGLRIEVILDHPSTSMAHAMIEVIATADVPTP